MGITTILGITFGLWTMTNYIVAADVIQEQELHSIKVKRAILRSPTNKDPGCLERNGVFGIPGDCDHYLVCSEGHATKEECPNDFKFDTYELCTLNEDADCGSPDAHHTEIREICPQNCGIFSYKADCHKFVNCDGGRGTVESCPEGLIFQEHVGCIEGDECPSRSAPAPIADQSHCLLPADEGSCDSVFERYYYDSASGTCQQFVYGGCGGNGNNFLRKDDCIEQCGGAVCPKEDGVFSIPGDCTHYLVCSEGRASKESCPEGFFYDSYDLCTLSTDADCGIPDPKHTEMRDLCPANYGNFPYKGDCHKFVSCDSGKGTVISCPEGLVFQEYVGCIEGNQCPGHSAPGPKTVDSICHLPPDEGTCDSVFARYYYDSETDKCQEFIYSGCGGNGNNFRRKDECMQQCSGAGCPEDNGIFPIPGDCTHYLICSDGQATKESCSPEFRFDSDELCTLSEDVDCGFPDAHHTEIREICPQNYGNFPYKGDCHKFVSCDSGKGTVISCPEGLVFQEYVGCIEGDQCPGHSAPVPIEDHSICQLPPDEGPCDSIFERYYYDSTSGTCLQFSYGGCEGNANNFHRKDECMEQCRVTGPMQSSVNVCALPPETGPCLASIRKYYFDSESDTCKKFTFGGCSGNGNNFDTKAECMHACWTDKSKPVEGFYCPGNGTFAHPSSCEKYTKCTEEGGDYLVLHCPPDQHYNIDAKICDEKCNAHCAHDLACTCQWAYCDIKCEEPEGFLNVESDNRLYVYCTNNVAKVYRCPEGKVFDDAKKTCVLSNEDELHTKMEAQLKWLQEHDADPLLINDLSLLLEKAPMEPTGDNEIE